MSDALRIYLTGTCNGFDALSGALAQQPGIELVGMSEHPSPAGAALAGGHLDCVLHGTTSATLPTHELALIREHTPVPIVIAAAGESSVLLEQALVADVMDVVLLPTLVENVVFALRKAAQNRRLRTVAPPREGRIVTVFSPKGGTGKTVIATNLAVALAKHAKKRTLLLDLDLQFGDAAIVLGIEPEKTILDLVTAPGELDPDKLAGYATKHQSGLDLLPAPLRPEDAELVTEAKLRSLIEVAQRSYDAIVVDTSPFFHGPMLATLDRTEELLVLCALDVATLKNVRLALGTLELLSFPSARISVALNFADSKNGMKQNELEAALARRVRYQIPTDRAVPLSINRGAPAVTAAAGSEFTKAIDIIAKGVLTPEKAKSARRLIPSLARA